eukprot:m.6267 g.6267  ORF g.6267 m.6267 type:complete len:1041 (+) comp5142_c0_seq1:166-3288(+)
MQVLLETGDVYMMKRAPAIAQDILSEVASHLKFHPDSVKCFGLCYNLDGCNDLAWVIPGTTVTATIQNAASQLKLMFKLRTLPESIGTFSKKDPEAASYALEQMHNAVMSGDLLLSAPSVLKLITLRIVNLLIDVYHNEDMRCSQVKPQAAFTKFKSLAQVESFTPQATIDDMTPQTLDRAISTNLKQMWPLRKYEAATKYLKVLRSEDLPRPERFNGVFTSHDIKGSELALTVGLDGISIETVLRTEKPLSMTLLQKVVVDTCNCVTIYSSAIPSPWQLRCSNLFTAENLATAIDTCCFISTGRVVSQYESRAAPLHADFGVMERSDAEALLKKHGCVQGMYLVRKSPSNDKDYGLSVCHQGRVDHFKITLFPSMKYGIQTGLRYKTLSELIEHYHQQRDGMSTNILQNVHLLECGASDAPPPIAARRSAHGLPSQQPPKATLESIEVARSNITLQKANKLGKGEFGLVVQGTLHVPSTPPATVAVKILHSREAAATSEFLQEANLMVALNHPHIVRLLGVCLKPELMMICELMPLGAINSFLSSQSPAEIPVTQLMLYSLQIADGMKYLENVKFVHRDLAARNILVKSKDIVKIADFGLSRSVGESQESLYVAKERGRWPIKWYAPESICFCKFTHKSDVWSFAVTTWEIFMRGKKPFIGLRGKDVVQLVIHQNQRLERPPEMPLDVMNLLNKCWAYEPDDRPSFAEVYSELELLQGLAGGRPVEVADPHEMYSSILRSQQIADTEMHQDELRRDMPEVAVDPSIISKSKLFIPSDNITLQEAIGAGSFGQVFLGCWKTSSGPRSVALKTLRNNSSGAQTLLHEANIMTTLQHPNLVCLHGISQVEGAVILVTELINLGPMNTYLQENPSVTPEAMLRFVVQIADAMAFMETQRFVHRDLAARNVLVDTPTLCKITDFGLSRALSADSTYYRSANRGKWPIKWYAPECLFLSEFTNKSDVWSFAVTIWEVFSRGSKPYAGMTGRKVVEFLDANQRLAPPSEMPAWLADLMGKCWQTKPTSRPTFSQIQSTLKSKCPAL